jgi:retron-type reverse transcriptase
LKKHWPAIREQLETGRYRLQPLKRVKVPKPDGSNRGFGIDGADRFIQQAIAQVLCPQWEPKFQRDSFGFRLNHSAHQAVGKLQADIRQGYRWVVDLDL